MSKTCSLYDCGPHPGPRPYRHQSNGIVWDICDICTGAGTWNDGTKRWDHYEFEDRLRCREMGGGTYARCGRRPTPEEIRKLPRRNLG